MKETNYFKLGLFVILTFLLFLGTLIFLGMLDQFKAKATMMTIVTESVQGLTPGSKVKFQGVPIGRVTEITIDTESGQIRIDMEIDLSKIRVSNSKPGILGNQEMSRNGFYDYMVGEIKDDGLRCRIDSEGITGMKYIEFEYIKDLSHASMFWEPGFAKSDVFYMPSVPSLMSDLRSSVVSILDKMESVDYKGVSDKLIATLESADKFLNDPKIRNILQELEGASAAIHSTVRSLNESLTEEKIQTLLKNSEIAMQSVSGLSEMLEKELRNAEIGKTSEEARNALSAFRKSNYSFVRTMNELTEGIDALVELLQYIETDPAALLRGKASAQEK